MVRCRDGQLRIATDRLIGNGQIVIRSQQRFTHIFSKRTAQPKASTEGLFQT